jgi:translation initiation factor 3 subunit A
MIAGLWHVCHKEYELTMFVLSLKMQEVTKLTKQSLMEEAFSEQMKERAEMERKLQKLSKTMDHLERAKREEERPLIEEAHQKRLQDDEKFYKDQQEVTFLFQLAPKT